MMVRTDRMEDARPQAPTNPGPVGYIPNRSRGMKMSQLFFSRSSSSGGLLYNTVTSRRNRLPSQADMMGEERWAERSEGRVVPTWGDEDLQDLERSSRSMRRWSSYTSLVRLRMRVKR